MRIHSRLLIFPALLLVLSLALPNTAQASHTDDDVRMTPVVRAVQASAAAVVNISSARMVERRTGFEGNPLGSFLNDLYGLDQKRQFRAENLGSGVIIDGAKGLVLTNAHVIAGSSDITVRLQDGREIKAELVGSDSDFDLAVLKVETAQPLPQIRMADSSDILIGETVIAIGNPFGFSHTVTTGVVSALNRSIKTPDGVFTDFIQTDAAINPGNSGGPLLNLKGELIGVNTAIKSDAQGIGFAIPINKAKRVMNELLSTGQVSPVWLGIFGQSVDQRVAAYYGLAQPQGLLVTEVSPGSPAAKAGIKPGDLIQELGGVKVADKNHYLDILKNHTRGEALSVKLKRGSQTLTIEAEPAPLTEDIVLALTRERWGLIPSQARQTQGVLLEAVRPGSPAQRLELAPGDLVVQIGNIRVKGMAEFLSAAMAYRLQNNILLGVVRGGRLYYARLVL